MCRYYFTYISESNMFYFFASFLCSARLSVLSVWCWDVTCVCNVCVFVVCWWYRQFINCRVKRFEMWMCVKQHMLSHTHCASTQIPSSPHRKQIRYKHKFCKFSSLSLFSIFDAQALHWIFIIVCLFVFGVVFPSSF